MPAPLGNALIIIATAKRRLATEYEDAKAAGAVAKQGRPENMEDQHVLPTQADLGVDHRIISEGRKLNEAEAADPG
jgi:hypothetical protein